MSKITQITTIGLHHAVTTTTITTKASTHLHNCQQKIPYSTIYPQTRHCSWLLQLFSIQKNILCTRLLIIFLLTSTLPALLRHLNIFSHL